MTSIGQNAFCRCRGLTSVTIPNSVTSIEHNTFVECSGLTSIIVESGNKVYDSRGNCNAIIKTETNELIAGCKNTIIPNSVTGIGSWAFMGCSGLTSITIPNSVTSIGFFAFYGCSGLTSVVIPNSVTSIESGAFYGCSGLTSVTIPNSVASIGEKAFEGCSGLTSVTIPNSVTFISGYAFKNCSGLTSITIGNGVQSINEWAFASCKNLTDVYCHAKDVPYTSVNAFEGSYIEQSTLHVPEASISSYKASAPWSSFKNITDLNSGSSGSDSAPSGTAVINGIYYNLMGKGSIAEVASNPNKYSGDIVIPSSLSYGGYSYTVKSIGREAFYNCGNLTSVTIPNSVTFIGDIAFCNCSGLTSVTIPNSVTSTGLFAFSGCTGLTSVTIPNSVTSIGEGAFSGCTGLTSVTIPNSVTSIGEGAFSSCSGLTSVTIPNSVTTIEIQVFLYCSGLTSVTIGNSVTSIGAQAFKGCTGLTSVTIPNSVTFIEGYAFEECSGLTSIMIGSGVKSIDYKAFAYCKNLTDVYCYAKTLPNTYYNVFEGSYIEKATLHVQEASISNYKATTPWSSFKNITDLNGNTTFSLTITATGNGAASYNNSTIRGKSSTFTINEGTDATITFTPDNGYKIKSVKVNGSTVNVSDNRYVVSSISQNTTIEVEFEPITHTLSISAVGNGSASYDGTVVRGKTSNFTVKEGTSVVISFTPDNGYKVKAVKVNGSDVTVSNNQYTVSNINQNTTVEVEFETITYTLSVISTGNGSASYNGTIVRDKTSSFNVNEGTNTTITFTPDNGYRIKTVKVNNTAVTVSNNQYTVSNFKENTTVSVEFEVIPPTTYSLTISATGNGSASYNGTTVRDGTKTITVNEGTSVGISLNPDNDYRIKSVKENNTIVTSYVSNGVYTINSLSRNTTVEVEFEAIPPTTYTFSITATGNGSVSFDGTTIRGESCSFTVIEGINATIIFNPDNGYRVNSVKVNNTAVTVSNNQYTVSNINANTTVAVEFEAIPIPTYTLSLTATGNGTAFYSGTTVRDRTSSFTLNEGTNATITFTPDNGYRIKIVKVNGSTITVNSNNQYTVSNIKANTTVEVEFEVIPVTTYTLTILADGGGKATYEGSSVRFGQREFTVNEGTSATISFVPDDGCRIKSVKVNGSTVSVSNNQYTISNINRNTTVTVEFEEIPPTTYTLSITATGSGSASYNGTTARGRTASFTVNEGTNATITFTPDNGYRVKTVNVNNTAVAVSNNQYTVSKISRNTTVSVEFEGATSETLTLDVETTIMTFKADQDYPNQQPQTFRVKSNTSWSITTSESWLSVSPTKGEGNEDVNVVASTYRDTNSERQAIITITADKKSDLKRTIAVIQKVALSTYTLSITATGNGSASYNGTTVRGRTASLTVNEGTNATITFTPDNGYRIKTVKVNGSTVTVNSNNQYTVSNISRNTTVSVEFEAIPPTTYTLSISSFGNGSASYNGTTVRGKETSFTVNEGTNATITFSPDNGFRIKSVMVNNITVAVSNNQYTINNINRNTTVSVDFEAITYTFSISATGNGSAYYNGTTVRDRTHTFIMNEGTSATVYFYPDNGYRIKTVKINGATVNVSNNQYSINSLKQSTTVAVEFEAIPPTTYTLSITATGYGSASYNGTTVRGRTTSFTVNEGTNATITFIPDNGYRIKTVKVNNAAVAVSNNQYTVSSISRNTTVNVEFEVIPPTTYTLSITATGNGSASYNGTTVRGRTTSFTVNEGTNATITFSPDNGYRVKSVMVNNLTVSVSNNQYTVSNISRNTTISVEFEAIPPTTYTLSITATGYGSASYNGTTVRGRTTSFAVNEGTNATVTFSPDAGYRIKTVKVNDAVVAVSNNQYTVSNISRNTTVSIEFEGAISEMAVDGVSYRVVSLDSRTINVSNGNYGEVLRVPATVSYEGLTFVVAGIESGALANATNLAAVVWEPATQFTELMSNPNLLLYVSSADYAPAGIQNVVVNGVAEHIVLTEAQSGNDFYCPEEFTARSISLTHKYSMVSGLESCQGWETIVLPFDVQSVTHATKGMLKPFATWQQSDSEKPFWLYELSSGGWTQATGIRANVPYIISMPNNEYYRESYRLYGYVTFSANNVKVKKTEEATAVSAAGKTLVPNFRSQSASNEVFALNVVNDYDSETAGAAAGSQFVRQLRNVHPFEAYMTVNNTTRGDVIPVFDDREATRIGATLNDKGEMINDKWYSFDGRKLEEKPTRKGVYIMNGKKVVIR